MKAVHTGIIIAGSLLSVAAVLGRHSGIKSVTPMAPGSVDFIVSSAADAGPGSLRDAILAADRLGDRAHIVITAKQITLESALPALINPHGVTLEAAAGAGTIDAARQAKGSSLQINSKASSVRGIRLINAHEQAILVSASGVEFDSVTVSASKNGILFTAQAKGCAVRNATFDSNETGILAEPGADDLTVVGTTFRNNNRAGFWFVSSAGPEAVTTGPTVRERARIMDSTFDKNASGIVLANQATLIQKNRFTDNRESAILVLSGMARIEDNEVRGSQGAAISVIAGRRVIVARNQLRDNKATAISVRDSQATIEHNTLQGNGFGIVAILGDNANPSVIADNEISKSIGDAITLIGGAAQVLRNQLLDNHGAGLRVLDYVSPQGALKATPHLEANNIQHNGADLPQTGSYKVAATVQP